MAHKLPKRLLGVKIPKSLRKSSLVDSLLNSQAGRKIVADALIAAAGAASTALLATQTETGQKATDTLEDTGSKSGKLVKRAIQSAAHAMTESLGNAAQSLLPENEERNQPRRVHH